jgi:hypothetical protein
MGYTYKGSEQENTLCRFDVISAVVAWVMLMRPWGGSALPLVRWPIKAERSRGGGGYGTSSAHITPEVVARCGTSSKQEPLYYGGLPTIHA